LTNVLALAYISIGLQVARESKAKRGR